MPGAAAKIGSWNSTRARPSPCATSTSPILLWLTDRSRCHCVLAGSRAATLNPNWGGVIEPNTFGTHEFMDFLDQIGFLMPLFTGGYMGMCYLKPRVARAAFLASCFTWLQAGRLK